MTSPSPEPRADFQYRHNPDGTWDSICLLCFQTAASADRFEDLAALERQHQCYVSTEFKRSVRPDGG